MAVGPATFPEIMHAISGVRLGTVSAGIKRAGRNDLVAIEISEQSQVAAVFTRNRFCAAPVLIAKRHLATAQPRYLLINTGNANAGTGETGIKAAQVCCQALAQQAGCAAQQVLPFSTGVIGEPLPTEKITAALPQLLPQLLPDGWRQAAEAILTTDTRPKGASVSFDWQGQSFHVTGIAKGSGMIRPDMATMLAFVATDAAVTQEVLQQALTSATERSFNRISVDGDTSTNDACVLIATGAAHPDLLDQATGERYERLLAAVTQVCIELAQAIVRDGEGATKFVSVQVSGGRDQQECLAVAYAVAHSPLVKTALFASDPNWGRILAAVGRAGLADLAVEGVTIHLDEVCIVARGGVAADYSEAKGQRVMAREEITIAIDLGRGDARDQVWTTDLSHDYVRINAEYRT